MNTERAKRKLSAILSADVKGYSRLMGEDEVTTVRTLKEYREVMSKLIKEYRGRVVDSPGDNVLAEFASVVDALECSVEIQKALKNKNAALPDNRKMEFRIGVNLGDVIEDEDRVYGDGINIAARIEGLAEPGGICVSGSAFEQVRNKLPLGYEYLGEHMVKNIVQPIKVYRILTEPEHAGKVIGERGRKERRWRWAAVAAVVMVGGFLAVWNFYFRSPPIEPASKEKMAFPLPDKPSIAVLAFTNMSDDKSQEYFSDGLAEEIINALTKLPQIFVIARNSSFTYKGKSVDVRQVGREMGVQYVLEGSVRREGNRVRITTQLVDATTGNHVFSERYDRELKDLFAMQDEITMKISTAMRVQLTEGEFARAFSKGTRNIEAYLKTLQSYEKRQLFTKESQAQARQLAEEAVALDPAYAMAYCGLATALCNEVVMGVYKNPREVLARAMEMAQKAVVIDDSLGQAHVTLGFASIMHKRDFDKGIAEAERAVALEPNSADIVAMLAMFLTWGGRSEEAIPIFKKAMRLSPIPQPRWLFVMANAYRMVGQYEEAISICKRIIQKQPDQSYAHIVLAATYMDAGREEEARAEAAEILRIDPKFSLENFAKATPRKDQAELAQMVELLRKAGLK